MGVNPQRSVDAPRSRRRDRPADPAPLATSSRRAGSAVRTRSLFRSGRSESGQAAVEFALVVPLICAIVLVLVDFGKAMNYWLDLQEVANQGARLAAVKTDFSADSLRTSLKSTELRTGGSTSMPAGAKICVDPGSGQVGDPVTVETTSDYHWVSLPSWIPIGGGGVFTIKGRATMRLERQVLYSAHCSG